MNAREVDHDAVRTLLGAYVLDAVSPLERHRIERHLTTCPECARESRLLMQSAAELAFLAGEETVDDGFVERVVSKLPAQTRPSRTRFRVLAGVAAAALIVAGVVSGAYVRESSRNDRLTQVVASATRTVRLDPSGGFPARGALYLTQDRAALVLDDVPEPERARTYQLWAIRDGTPTSMATFSGRDRVVRVVRWDEGGQAFAVTVEPEGGSRRPTGEPVLSGA